MNYGQVLYWSIEAVIVGSGLLVLVGIAAAAEIWLRHRRDRLETNRQIAQHRAELKKKINEARTATQYLPPVTTTPQPPAYEPPDDVHTVTWPKGWPKPDDTGENRVQGGPWQQ